MTIFVHSDAERGKVPLRQRRPRAAAVTKFARALDTLDIPQFRAAKIFDVSERSLRRWRDGTRRAPAGVIILCRLLAAKAITAAQIERAAADPVPRTNGGGALLVEPAPEQSALTGARTAARANPGLSITELTAATCRWPVGTPGHSDFYYCGNLTTTNGPYCKTHDVMAHRPGFRPSGTHECPAHRVTGEKQTSAARNSSCFSPVLADK
jgi:hypothetical protein